jgi:hypothetical protein
MSGGVDPRNLPAMSPWSRIKPDIFDNAGEIINEVLGLTRRMSGSKTCWASSFGADLLLRTEFTFVFGTFKVNLLRERIVSIPYFPFWEVT